MGEYRRYNDNYDRRGDSYDRGSYNRNNDYQRSDQGRYNDRPNDYNDNRGDSQYNNRGGDRFQSNRGYDRGYDDRSRDSYYRGNSDRGMDRNFQHGKSGYKFSNQERAKLVQLHSEYPNDFENIGQQMNIDANDCKKQYLQWESQPDWSTHDADRVKELFNQGLTIKQIAENMNGRSPIGIYAKLSVLNRRRELQKPFHELDVLNDPELAAVPTQQQQASQQTKSLFQVADQLTTDARGLVNKAKNIQLEECKTVLKNMLEYITQCETQLDQKE